MSNFDQYIRDLKSDFNADKKPEEVLYLLLCDADPSYLEGQSVEEAALRAKRSLEFMTEMKVEVTDKDRQQVLASCFHCADIDALLAVGKVLDTSTEVWNAVVDEIFGDLMPQYPDWWLTPELLEKLKTLTRESGLGEIQNSDPRVMLGVMGAAMKEVERGYEPELGNILGIYGYELLLFVKVVEPLCAGFRTTMSKHNDVEIAADAYLESILDRGLGIDEVSAELNAHGLGESKWVGWSALKKVADYLIEIHENMPFSPGQGEWMAEYLSKIQLFYPECTSWEFVSRSAEIMLDESYTADSDRAALRRHGFSLEELTGAEMDDEPTLDELNRIENSEFP